MSTTITDLTALYTDNEMCARTVGLRYVEKDCDGISRVRRGKGFTYKSGVATVHNPTLKSRIAALVIPPAWNDVWICPTDDGHVLATGIDEKGRKQYIYHPKWRTIRDLIKFYRLIIFGRSLPKIRGAINKDLATAGLGREKVLATMLWILDNVYIRIGNDIYFLENESVGLTTLSNSNVVIAGSVVTLSFKGKSSKDQQITFEDKYIAAILTTLRKDPGERLFRYQADDTIWHELKAEDINTYLHETGAAEISAKDFRTWGGTLMAFLHLTSEQETKEKKPEKVVVAAIDQAAAVLGNTRSVARSSYVHPHLLSLYGTRDFAKIYAHASKQRKVPGLDKSEGELLFFLEELFMREYAELKPYAASSQSTALS